MTYSNKQTNGSVFKRQSAIYFHIAVSYSFFPICLFSLDVLSFTLTVNQLSSIILGSLFFSSTTLMGATHKVTLWMAIFPGYCLSIHLLISSLLFLWAQQNWFLFVDFAFSLCRLLLLSGPVITLFSINQFLLFFHLLLFLLYPYFISSFPLFFASFLQVIVLVIFLCQLFLLI